MCDILVKLLTTSFFLLEIFLFLLDKLRKHFHKFTHILQLLSGQLPPRKIAPPSPADTCPFNNCPPDYFPPDNCPRGQLPLRKTASPPRIITPWIVAPGFLVLDNYLKDNCPLTIYPCKLPLRKIAFRMNCRLP